MTARPVESSEAFPWFLLVVSLALLALIGFTQGCGGAPPQQGGGLPGLSVEFQKGQMSGLVELAKGDRVMLIDLSTGVIAGEGPDGWTVLRWDVDGELSILVNQQPHGVELQSRNTYSGEWVHCLTGGVDVVGWYVRGRAPLHPSCGPSGLLEMVRRVPFQPQPVEPGG
jgi:hypothetical protein